MENDDDDDEVAGDDEVDVHWGGTTHVSVGLLTLSFDFLPASHLSAMLYTLYVFVFVFEVLVFGIPTSFSFLSVPGWQILREAAKDFRRKVWTRMKI